MNEQSKCARVSPTSNKRCPWVAVAGSEFCWQHGGVSAEERARIQAERSAKGRAKRAAAKLVNEAADVPEVELDSVDGLRALLERAIVDLFSMSVDPIDRSKELRAIVGVAVDLLKANELRIENDELRRLVVEKLGPEMSRRLKLV